MTVARRTRLEFMAQVPAAPPELREVAEPGRLEEVVRELGAEPRACLLCGAESPRRRFKRFGKWHWSCRSCRFVWVHDIYPEFVVTEAPQVVLEVFLDSDKRRNNPRLWRPMFAEFEGYRGTGHLLDVGCGPGFLVGEAVRRGWKGQGVETREVLAEYARDELGLEVFHDDLIAAALPDDRFDVVHLNEVIEHVVDPVGLLREIHRVLRPGGMAYLRTGCVESWSARWRAERWSYYAFAPGGHIRFFGPKSARALGRAAGYGRVRASTRGFALREGGELRGHWYRPLVRLAQSPVSPLATLCNAGHRLTMRLFKDDPDSSHPR